MKTKKKLIISLVFMFVLAAVEPAAAKVTELALYRLGEDDPGAAAGNTGNELTVDSIAANNLARTGDPTYNSETVLPCSNLSMEFDGDDYYRTSGFVYDLGEDNWGIEGWAYSTDADQGGWAFANGMYIIGQWSGRFLWHCTGQGDVAGTPLETNVWTHMALVRDNGVLTAYMNGQPLASTDRTDQWNRDFCIGAHGGGAEFWIGLVDHVRLFKFNAGEFEVSDLTLTCPTLDRAANPQPTDGATDVPREVILSWKPGEFAAPTNGHKVYFSENFNDVNDGIGGITQDANSYTPPQRLDLNTTYYWRVDEVNAPPSSTIFKGDVWSFTAEPIGYPIDGNNITATASSSGIDQGPENTVNGSGLDVNGLHSTEQADMWISDIAGPQPTWIQYEFDKVCKLHQMWVWNHNTLNEPAIGFGVKDGTIEYSLDGASWTTLGTTHEFARGSGAAGYAYNTTVDFGGVTVKYVRLTANSNWGGLLPQYGLSEVRFLYIPVWAREPNPASGATDVDVDLVLSFRAGREAAEHNVYISTDEQAVIDSNVPVSIVTEAQDGPISLDLDETYYWKVNEVNEAETPTMWQGEIWNFSTPEFLVVDDFELYNDLNPDDPDSNRIFNTWIDGYDNPAINGSVVGYAEAPFTEQSIVYDGKQSMPFNYDNSTAGYSEATANIANLQVGQDWTRHGIKALTLMFLGDPNNAVQQMYVKLNGSKVTYDGDVENIRRTGWQMWYIDLSSLGVSLSNVTELSIGFERSGAVGGSGVVYFDGIRLYPHERQLITPVEPNTAGLVGHWPLDGNPNNISANGYDGVAEGGVTYGEGVLGQAADFNGSDALIDCGDVPVGDTGAISIAFWVKPRNIAQDWAGYVSKWTVDNSQRTFWLGQHSTDGWLRFGIYPGGPTAETSIDSGQVILANEQWTHIVCTYDGDFQRIYAEGVEVVSSPERNAAIVDRGGNLRFGIVSTANWFNGLIDDVRIYDRVLSSEEIAWLGGVTKPFDKPF